MKFEHITLEQGLSQSFINDILQDSRGFMWFCTQDGLNRYDGYSFKIYKKDPDNINSISYNHTTLIYESRDGKLWVGTYGGGLNLFDRNTEQFIAYQYNPTISNSLSNDHVTSILEDGNGVLWIGTEGGGLNRLEQTGFSHYRHDPNDSNSLIHDVVNAIFEDKSGELWVGTAGGLDRFDREQGRFIHYQHEPNNQSSLSSNIVMKIYEDFSGELWIGTDGGGLNRLDRANHAFIRYVHDPQNPHSLSHNAIRSIYQQRSGILWVGTDGGGLNKFEIDKERFVNFKHEASNPKSLNLNRISAIHVAESGIIWVGTWGGGVNKFDPTRHVFDHYQHIPGNIHSLSHNAVWAVNEDSNGYIWIGTDGGGLSKFDQENETYIHYQHDEFRVDSLSDNNVYSIYEDRSGVLWIGTWGGGLNKLNRESDTFTRYKHDPSDPQSLGSNVARTILEDRDGTLWIGTWGGGLNKFVPETETFIHYRHDPSNVQSLSQDIVREIYLDRSNLLWIGTLNGLNKFDSKREHFTRYIHDPTNQKSISNNKIGPIYEDSFGNIWVGTFGGGLNKFDPSGRSFKHYLEKDGLPNNLIFGLLPDDHGNLWLSTGKGISKFNPRTENFTNFDVSHGLQSNDFNAGAFYKKRNGEMLFGGVNGFNIFNPDSVMQNTLVPEIRITDFQIFNHSVPIGKMDNDRVILQKAISEADSIELSYKDNVFSFEFAALLFTSPEKNSYAYMMEGFEKEWNYVGNRRFVTYTNLPPGDYGLKIKASNNDGVWNNDARLLSIKVTPPYWQTWWFRILAGLLFVFIVYFGYKIRIRNIKQHNKLLENKVEARTYELRSKTNELEDQKVHLEQALEELQDTKDELVEEARKAGMADVASGVLHNVGNILNTVNISSAIIRETVVSSKITGLVKANSKLRENLDDIENFIINNPNGKKLMQYYFKIEEALLQEQTDMITYCKRLTDNIVLINDVIAAQQSYVNGSVLTEELSLEDVLEDALKLQTGTIVRDDIRLIKKFNSAPKILFKKTKLIDILMHVFKNAKEAMGGLDPDLKEITIEIDCDGEYVYLKFSDTGCGIENANLNKIFMHGFTTKNDAHGFGLHSCANYMTEMGGRISVESEGIGRGATFVMTFPIQVSTQKKAASY